MIKIIVIVLAVVVLSLGLTVWGLQRYMVYSSDGGKLVLPWMQETGGEDGAASQPQEDNNGASAVVSSVVTSGNTNPQESATGDTNVVNAVQISQDQLLSGNASDLIKEQNADGVVLEMKNADGKLSYVSHQDLAGSLYASPEASVGEQVAQAIQDLKKQGVYLIAYVDCFEDRSMSGKDDLTFQTIYGFHWLGDNDIGWGNPTKSEVRDYLSGIVGELAELGFDEILLDHAGYPTEGTLTNIQTGSDYDSTQFSANIKEFYTQAAKAAEDGGAKLSVVTDQNTIQSGSNELNGQTLDNLALVGRVWMKADANADTTELEKKLTEAGMNDHPLGMLTDVLQSDKNYYQAVLDTE